MPCSTARSFHTQDWKTDKYKDIVGSGSVAARPGVVRLMDEARAAGVPVAVCSAATKAAVEVRGWGGVGW